MIMLVSNSDREDLPARLGGPICGRNFRIRRWAVGCWSLPYNWYHSGAQSWSAPKELLSIVGMERVGRRPLRRLIKNRVHQKRSGTVLTFTIVCVDLKRERATESVNIRMPGGRKKRKETAEAVAQLRITRSTAAAETTSTSGRSTRSNVRDPSLSTLTLATLKQKPTAVTVRKVSPREEMRGKGKQGAIELSSSDSSINEDSDELDTTKKDSDNNDKDEEEEEATYEDEDNNGNDGIDPNGEGSNNGINGHSTTRNGNDQGRSSATGQQRRSSVGNGSEVHQEQTGGQDVDDQQGGNANDQQGGNGIDSGREDEDEVFTGWKHKVCKWAREKLWLSIKFLREEEMRPGGLVHEKACRELHIVPERKNDFWDLFENYVYQTHRGKRNNQVKYMKRRFDGK